MAKIKAKKSEIVVETKKEIKAKQKKVKLQNTKETTEAEDEVKRFVSILVVTLLLIGVIYFFTKKTTTTNTTNEVTIQYNDISVGMILNRNEYSEYYVLAYFDDSENYSELYSLYRTYRNREDVTKLYTVNLNDPINKGFVTTGNSVLNVSSVSDFRFATDTLIYIKEGKVVKTYTTFKEIDNILK